MLSGTRKWGVSATMSLGFSPLSFLIGDLYGGSISSPEPKGLMIYTQRVSSEGVILLSHLNPSLMLVRKTNSPEEITKLARQPSSYCGSEPVRGFSLRSLPDAQLQQVCESSTGTSNAAWGSNYAYSLTQADYIFADQGGPHDRKNRRKELAEFIGSK